MYLAGTPPKEIGKQLGIPNAQVRYVVVRLKLKRRRVFETCPVCGWQGTIQGHTPSGCARKLLVRSLSEAGMSGSEIARQLGVSRNLVFLLSRRMGIQRTPFRAGICSVCGWRGVMSYHNPQRCAYFLRLRQMREAGLRRRVIVRELGISPAVFFQALQRMGLTASKTPK